MGINPDNLSLIASDDRYDLNKLKQRAPEMVNRQTDGNLLVGAYLKV